LDVKEEFFSGAAAFDSCLIRFRDSNASIPTLQRLREQFAPKSSRENCSRPD
jgi:hypothetical protein